jgi:hypothetical protein
MPVRHMRWQAFVFFQIAVRGSNRSLDNPDILLQLVKFGSRR